jgi:type VI secretion system protein VasD
MQTLQLNNMRIPAILIAAVTALLLQGCGGPPERPDTVVKASIVASGDVNSEPETQGRPIVLRLYELTSPGLFNSADFYSLYENEAEALGADLLAREEVGVPPGGIQQFEKVIAPETRYLGIIAAFRDLDRSQWRSISPIQPGTENEFTVMLTADSLTVAGK